MEKSTLASIIAIVATIALSAYFYPEMPGTIASHWNASGEANGFMEKELAIAVVPALQVAMLLLLTYTPQIMPLKRNFSKFKPLYGWFIFAVVGFMAYIQVLMVAWNVGLEFEMGQALSPAFAGLFYVAGAVMQRTKRNWFMGIRTPWTLSSDEVWDRTHMLGGKLFKASGGIALLGMVFTDIAIWLVIVPVMLAAVVSVAYSYLEYKKLKRK